MERERVAGAGAGGQGERAVVGGQGERAVGVGGGRHGVERGFFRGCLHEHDRNMNTYEYVFSANGVCLKNHRSMLSRNAQGRRQPRAPSDVLSDMHAYIRVYMHIRTGSRGRPLTFSLTCMHIYAYICIYVQAAAGASDVLSAVVLALSQENVCV